MADLDLLPQALYKHHSAIERICRLRDDGRIHCVRLVSLLAFYRNKMARALVNDLTLLYVTHKHLNPSHNTLVSCGEGVWGSAQISLVSAERPRRLSEADGSGIRALCAGLGRIDKAAEVLASGGLSAAGLVGISGVTGIDPLGGRCGFGVDTKTDTQEFIDKAKEYIDEMSKRCEPTPQETASEGEEEGKGTEGLPGGSSSKEIKTATEITQNGDGTETVTTVDGDGNQVTETRPSTQEGNSVEVQYTDGSSGKSSSNPSGDGGRVYVEKTTDKNGRTTTVVTRVNPDGSGYRKTTSPNGRTTREEIPPLEPIVRDPDLLPLPPKDCGFEQDCADCRDFRKFAPKMRDACAGSDLRACRAFGEAAACCGNPSRFPADPRIVLPNPLGDAYCAGGVDMDAQKARCSALCKFAYSEDCYGDCLAKSTQVWDWSLLDNVCIYASGDDWCVGSDGGPHGPDAGRMPQPLPLPYSTQLDAILPLGQFDAAMPARGPTTQEVGAR